MTPTLCRLRCLFVLLIPSLGGCFAGAGPDAPAGEAKLTRAGAAPRPVVLVETAYPGANAQVVADVVAAPIELQVNGVEKALHLSSRCASDGTYVLSVTFAPGVDPEKAVALVQKRVNLALPTLPDVVKIVGVTVRRKTPDPLLLVTLSSPGGRFDTLYLGNYAAIQIKDELARAAGVGAVTQVGQQDYSLRVWLDPEKLAARGVTVADVVDALRQQNVQVAAGQIGQPPAAKGKEPPIRIKGAGRLVEPEAIGDTIVKVAQERVVRVKDVGQVEPGAVGRGTYVAHNGTPAALLAVVPKHGARPKEVAGAVREKLKKLRAALPDGLRLEVAFDFSEGVGGGKSPGYLLADVAMPDAASAERTAAVLRRCEKVLRRAEGVEEVLALDDGPFDGVRGRPCVLLRSSGGERTAGAVRELLHKEIQEAAVRVRAPLADGRALRWEYPVALAVHGPEAGKVLDLAEELAEQMGKDKRLTDVWASRDSRPVPQVYLDVDRDKVRQAGVALRDVFEALQAGLGGLHVNDFDRFGRTWQIQVRAGEGRKAEEVKLLKVRGAGGELVPLARLVTVREAEAPAALYRIDGRPAVEVTANLAAGCTPAQARALCERLADEMLPAGYRVTWLRDAPAAGQ